MEIRSFRGPHAFLSNFHWRDRVTMPGGREYLSAEHAFQAAKAITQQDHDYVARQTSPGNAKRAGRAIKCRVDWPDKKNEIMLEIIRAKFRPGSELAAKLDETGDAELIEGNSWGDRYWGVYEGIGQNWLGKILMQVRDENRSFENLR